MSSPHLMKVRIAVGAVVEDRHLVLVDQFPVPPLVGSVRGAFVHELGGAVRQRAVHDVGVPGYPADVGAAPEDVAFGFEVEDGLVCVGDLGQVSAGGVQDSLGFCPWCPKCRECTAVCSAFEGCALVFFVGGVDDVVPPHVLVAHAMSCPVRRKR